MTRVALFSLLLLAACKKGGGEASTPDNTVTGEPEGGSADAVTLVELQMGDESCNVTVRDAAGADVFHTGTFEVCEATALIGKPVQLRFDTVTMAGPTCEGDPECTDHEDVEAVVEITAAE